MGVIADGDRKDDAAKLYKKHKNLEMVRRSLSICRVSWRVIPDSRRSGRSTRTQG